MRISSTAGLLLLAACSAGSTVVEPDEDDLIDCALGGAIKFNRDCVVEWGTGFIGGTNGMVVRHPDGSFRRLTVYDDGRGFETADGADRAVVSASEDWTYVTVGSDRYRFPGKLVLDDLP